MYKYVKNVDLRLPALKVLKAVLLHIGKQKLSTPIAHYAQLNESYNIDKILLITIRYSHYQRSLCGNLKVIGILMKMLEGFTKHSCFLCLRDSSVTPEHYATKEWPTKNC